MYNLHQIQGDRIHIVSVEGDSQRTLQSIDQGGGGGTTDYDKLKNKPSIGGVTLEGDKSLADLGIDIPEKVSELENDTGYITGIDSADVTGALGYTPYNATNPNGYVNATGAANAAPVQSVNGQTGDVSLTIPTVPTNVSAFNNDAGYLTSETDPTVPAWAKEANKPSYTAAEVGAVPTSRTVNGKALSSDITLGAGDVGALPDDTAIPSKTSDLVNDSGFLHGNTRGVFYGTSTTAAATAEKAVTCADFKTADRVPGAIIFVMIGHTNTAAVADLSMNVNGTGARSIKYINNGTLGDLPSAGHLKTGYVYPFYFDSDYWVCLYNYNTTYSGMSDAEIAAGTGTTNRLITPARLKTAVQTWEHVNSVNGQTGAVSLTIPTVPTDVSAFNNDAGYLTLSTLPIYGGGVG